jgi:D-3-phosphoglycerate dehydrogenase
VAGGHWDFSVAAPVFRIRDLTVGLIAFGKIARRFAEKLRGFGCHMLAYDPYVDRQTAASLGVELVDFPALLKEADIVSIHAPLTEQTHHLFGPEAFGSMKRTAIIINTSRGALIDESALAQALDQGLLAGAALDVMEQEPLDPSSPLIGRDNVLITPHCAFYSAASLQDLQILTARGVAKVLRGEKADHQANRLSGG